VLVVETSICGLVRGILLSEYVLAFILRMITGDLFKMILNWTVLTKENLRKG
jgi:hypothetical protein